MGVGLRNYKNNCRGRLLPDNKSVGGTGRLTDKVIDQIQTYYGYAIRNNKGNRIDIIKSVWAIFYHKIRGSSYETEEQQHAYCPVGEHSWCKHKKDLSNGTSTYDRTNFFSKLTFSGVPKESLKYRSSKSHQIL